MLISTFTLICVITIAISSAVVISSQDYEPRRSTRNTANRVEKDDDTKDHYKQKKRKEILLAAIFPSTPLQEVDYAPKVTPNTAFNGWQPYGAADQSRHRMFLVDKANAKEQLKYGTICTPIDPIPTLLNTS